METNKLPDPIVIPDIMETIRVIKDKIALETKNMTYNELRRFLDSPQAVS